MHRVALSLLHHEADAQDAVQEAFLHLWKGRDELDRVLNLQAYCVSMAKRKSIDLLRRKRPEISIQSSELESEILNLKTDEGVFPDEEPLQKVLRLLPQLTEAQQQAIRLKYLEGQDNPTIETKLNLTPDNLRQTLCRGFKRLRELL